MWEITLEGEKMNPKLGFKDWQKYRKLGRIAIYNMLELENDFIEMIVRNCANDRELFHSFQWIICPKLQQKGLNNESKQ